MVNRFIKLQEVIEVTGLSAPTIYRHVKQGNFPKPVRLGARSSRWVESEINGWIEDRIASSNSTLGASNDC